MRIISGTLRGKNLSTPLNWDTRPTSDKARQGIFNIIDHAEWGGIVGRNIIDVFAGTGAMGIEALSRGAKFGIFIENNNNAYKILEENINSCRMGAITKLLRQDATKLKPISPSLEKSDLVFLDPPYGYELLLPSINALYHGDWLADGAIIIAETKKGEEFTPPEFCEIIRNVNYGINAFSIMRLK